MSKIKKIKVSNVEYNIGADYVDVDNKPSINNVPLLGNKTLTDLGIEQVINQTIEGQIITITPVNNTIYKCGELESLTISNPPSTGAYIIIFDSGTVPTNTSFPSSLNGLDEFVAEANTRYEISVLDGYAVVGSWEVAL